MKKPKKQGQAKRLPRGSDELPGWLEDAPAKPERKPKAKATRKQRRKTPPAAAEIPNASRARARELPPEPEPAAPAQQQESTLELVLHRTKGRPTLRTVELEERVLLWIACGEPLRAFCRLPGHPSHVTVHEWRKADKDFDRRYQRAREIGFHDLAERALEIANTPLVGEIVEEGENSEGAWSKVRREDMLGHRKLQVHTITQLLAKWSPTQYGNRVEHSVDDSFDALLRRVWGIADDPGKEQPE